ncbi:hypothetical protein [Arsukibacterium indicum]|uniref:DUF1496 domain-containing protein n=1 Tax=Arsukibacterium indicum TaxID=2848612 RepID=A0ABS6MME9_9GAMM|nr:hypothetical protein [Arsukibacterium indicum]MBV2129750.1 hypothetical protein [Arsukibacterium indicum]
MKLTTFSLFLFCVLQLPAAAAEETARLTAPGISVSDKNFPWQLVVDRGKILGCVYDNKFYSLGAILILESLPRKCELASDRNGLWEQLSEAELLLLQENIQKQQAVQQEATYIGQEPINDEEARLIRYLRSAKKRAESQ